MKLLPLLLTILFFSCHHGRWSSEEEMVIGDSLQVCDTSPDNGNPMWEGKDDTDAGEKSTISTSSSDGEYHNILIVREVFSTVGDEKEWLSEMKNDGMELLSVAVHNDWVGHYYFKFKIKTEDEKKIDFSRRYRRNVISLQQW